MKYFELDKEEVLLEAVESDEFKLIEDFSKQKVVVTAAAKNTTSKTRNINIRISEKVLHKLKSQAVREGIPYQTLAASILQKDIR